MDSLFQTAFSAAIDQLGEYEQLEYMRELHVIINRLLTHKANPNYSAHPFFSLLDKAVIKRNPDLLCKLLDHGAVTTNRTFRYATHRGHKVHDLHGRRVYRIIAQATNKETKYNQSSDLRRQRYRPRQLRQ